MEDTCNAKECRLFDLLGGEPCQCPNYQEAWWTSPDGGQPILIKDCAPKRTFLMIQDLHNRLIGVQKSNEQTRNSMTGLIQIMTQGNGVAVEIDDSKFLE